MKYFLLDARPKPADPNEPWCMGVVSLRADLADRFRAAGKVVTEHDANEYGLTAQDIEDIRLGDETADAWADRVLL